MITSRTAKSDPAAIGLPDLLSNAISALKVDSSAILVFEIFGPWGVNVEYAYGFSWTVVSGCIWMQVNGKNIEKFNPGDTFIFPRGTEGKVYTLLSSPEAKPQEASHLWEQQSLPSFKPGLSIGCPRLVRWGEGAHLDTKIVSTAFGFNDRKLGPLIEALPSLMVVKAPQVDMSFLDMLLKFPFGKESDSQPGYLAIAAQSVQLFLMHAVRAYALSSTDSKIGWLGGMSDPRISRALARMHAQPEEDWDLARLSSVAGMSRSLFAARFVECIGSSPKKYLGAWRMHLAREALAAGGKTVAALAEGLGYQSEAAFRLAFKKFGGKSPRDYVRSLRGEGGEDSG